MGVQLFIFYEAGLSLNVRRLLMELTVKDNIHALLLPWNVPFGTQTEFSTQELYFLDCFHRVVAKNYSDFALKLRLSDFVVSKEFQFNLYKYIQAYDSSVDVFQLDEKVFCEEYPSDLIAHNLFMPFVTMLKTRALDNKGNIKSVVYDVKKLNETLSNSKEFHSWFQKKGTQKAHFIPKDLALIYSYYKCGASSNDLDNFSADRSMWQYKDTFFKSHLYLLAKEAQLIDEERKNNLIP
ncbi:glycosyltransferase family 92 protein [Caerostris darwini]|uniref:Glycosyltransferase family 92 protein n=1 Tax=Caerostris darwini TaxID=1538125 RepID=A0AAV4U060_9ARAC|nr:glycosyltransferase family 92 protein [Caerostris darwini]